MFGIGTPEFIIIAFIILLLFGPGRLPKLSKTIGESARELRDGYSGGENNVSLKDITQEVTNSAKEIRQTIAEVKQTPLQAAEEVQAPEPPPATTGGGYGSSGYGREGNQEGQI